MIAFDLLKESSLLLRGEGAVSFLECELLLSAVLGVSREQLFLRRTEALRPSETASFREFFSRLMNGEPLAYILKKKEFYGLEFFVDRRVMIPRPETEMLVEWILSKAGEYGLARTRNTARFFLADVGTGSGNIAISVAKNVPSARVVALDISDGALAVCEKNAERHGVRERMMMGKSDLLSVFLKDNDSTRHEIASSRHERSECLFFSFLKRRRTPLPACRQAGRSVRARNDSAFFVIAANLPYIGTEKNRYISRSVENFEPHEALFGGMDGLEWYRRLFQQVATLKVPPHYVIGEIGFTQGTAILEEIRAVFPQAKACVRTDLAGLPRMFVLEPFCHPEPA